MAEPILFQVGIEGQDDILKVAEAIGEGLGAAFSKPNADIAKLNASIASLSTTITALGATSVSTATQIQGMAGAGDAFKTLTDAMGEFKANLAASTDEVENFGETLEKVGEQSAEAGKHIRELGASGSATSSAFNLLKTSVTGAVEVLTGGGISAGLRTIRELGEGAEQTASHFGKIGEAIGAVALRFGLFTAAVGATAAAILELGTHAAHATLDTINLATVLNQSVAQVVALQRRFIELGLSEQQAGTVVRTVATQIEESWSSIQKEVRDASENVIKDQLAIAEAGRGVEQAQVGVREAALATADAEEHAATAAADAARSAAEAQINASEAVIHQKEAEFDAQNKLADAQRAYADAVVSANEAQLNLADAQKEFQYSGDDAWRGMKDAIDAVADAERKAADEANAVQEALLAVDEAATSVKGAYVSLYAAQLAYREAHGEGRITRAERAELRREQTEVGLESAQERVRGAEFQAAKTRRDAVPEAQERQEKADRNLQASKEAEDKASQKYTESSERAADKLERSGSAAAAALEHVAKAGLEVQLAPQKAIDERAQAQLGVEDALANVRKTAYEAAHAQERAEDALETARINQREATDKARLAEFGLTDARNKAIENFSNSIATLQTAARTGRLPEGADPRLIRPESIARAAQATGGGDVRATLEAAQHIAQQLNLSTEKIFALEHELGIQRGAETKELTAAFRPGGKTFFPPPSEEDKKKAETITQGEVGARELIKSERDAAEALNAAAIKWGNLITPEITEFLKQDWWKQAGEIFGVAAALSLLQGLGVAGLGALLKGGVKLGAKALTRGAATETIEGEVVAAGKRAAGEAVEITHPTPAPKPTYPTTAESLVETAPKAPVVEPVAPAAGFFSGLTDIVSKAFLPLQAALQLLQGEASGLKAIKDIQEKAATERGEKPLTADELVAALKAEAGIKPEEKKPEAPKPEPKLEEKPEEKKAATTNLDAAAKRLDEAGVKLIDAAKALTGDKSATKGGASISDVAAKLEEIVTKLSKSVSDGGTGSKLDDAANKLDHSAEKLDEAADKISKGGGGDAADLQKAGDKIGEAAGHLGDLANKLGAGGLGGPEVRTQEQGDDAIKSIKESIDKLVGEKGVLQPPTDPKERSAYDEAVRKLIDSLTEINEAQKGLIEEQTRATAEGEVLTKAQEKLVEAQTALVRAQTAAVEKGEGAGAGGGGGGGGQAAAPSGGGGGGAAQPAAGGGGGGGEAAAGGGRGAGQPTSTGGGSAGPQGDDFKQASSPGSGGYVTGAAATARDRKAANIQRGLTESGGPQPQPKPPTLDVNGKPLIPGVEYNVDQGGLRIAPPESQQTPAAKAAARAAQSNVIKSVDEVDYSMPQRDFEVDPPHSAARERAAAARRAAHPNLIKAVEEMPHAPLHYDQWPPARIDPATQMSGTPWRGPDPSTEIGKYATQYNLEQRPIRSSAEVTRDVAAASAGFAGGGKQGVMADVIDRLQEAADMTFARRSAERKKAFDEAEMKKPPSERQLIFESQQPDSQPPPGWQSPPLSPDSPLRRRASQEPPKQNVTTTFPDVLTPSGPSGPITVQPKQFDIVGGKLEQGAAKIDSAADKLAVTLENVMHGGHAAGGPVVGPGGIDKVPIMATAGEYVVNVPATSKHRGLLEQINAGGELHFQLGGYVGGLNPGLAHEPSTGVLQSALTSHIGMGPGGYMMAKMQSQSTQSYAVDLRTDHGTYTVLATEDQMGAMLQGSIAQKIASTGPKPSWWS